MSEAILVGDKFQELTSINFGINFLKKVTALGCRLKNCSFYALIHFNTIKLELIISVADSSLTIETFNEGTFTRTKTINEFLENASNYNSLISALIDYCNKSHIKQIRCLTDNDTQVDVLISLGFEEDWDSPEECWVKTVSTDSKASDSYSLSSLSESFKSYGLNLTNVFFSAIMDFVGVGDHESMLGRVEYRYRLINSIPVISIFDATDFIGLNGVTDLLRIHLEEIYGMSLEIIM